MGIKPIGRKLFECTRIGIPIVDVLLDILLLAREEIPAHADGYHAVTFFHVLPCLATQYWVVDSFGAELAIPEEPISHGGDTPVARLIIYHQVAHRLIPVIIRSIRLLCHDISTVSGSPFALAHTDMIVNRDVPLVVSANKTAARRVAINITVHVDAEQFALESLTLKPYPKP